MSIFLRYAAYALGTGLLIGFLVLREVQFPGALQLQVYRDASDVLGTSEYSIVEWLQLVLISACGVIFGAVAWRRRGQRPLAVLFATVALACLVRELDYFLDLHFRDNLWQVMLALVLAIGGAYLVRHRRRAFVALARLWPSPAVALLFGGALVLFPFSNLIGHEGFWQALQGDDYRRIAKLAMEEMTELMGYAMCLCGAVEYWTEVGRPEGGDEGAGVMRRLAGLRRRD
ncbi:MAG: hypothetical protein P8172_10500 [Gammaproteobacteria bacterium]